ncbi:helix-turn-helix domain-containing protein [Nonomuraea sp. NEAU-A123]|uniref:helix-turn-helix domain-containing protein n=1 Tax=Nonomuraea sp. NEAU-A123 TaxID=2839649 RepID=UPI001BE409F0|nr:helix-turn-helix domain-containing protein [Nonomuraea sp. NEAU-A123]MBT2232204.1 hypothetical protein [Nonomuraea sp. NEAU-A123]
MPNRTPGFRRAELPTDHFTTVSNRWVRDKRLTWKARGVLAWLASHKVGFRISENTLIAAAPDGRDAVRGAIRELEKHGYLVRERQRASSGKLGRVDYILCDPWTAGNQQVSTNDGFSVPGGTSTPAPTPENPSQVPTSGNEVDAQAAPTTENPSQDVTSGNEASSQVSTNDGFSTPIRRTEEKKNKKKISDHLLAVGERTVRTARGAAQTPSANQEDLSRLAGDVLGQMPDHYRTAPAWLRSRMLKRISEALADHEPLALVAYAHKFASDPDFGDYEHLRRFADVIRKLDADVTDGSTCPRCGRDPLHTFCSADVEGGTR